MTAPSAPGAWGGQKSRKPSDPRQECSSNPVNASLLKILACSGDRSPLHDISPHVVCAVEHRYAMVDGNPVFLLSEEPQTHIEGTRSLAAAESGVAPTQPIDNSDPNAIDSFVKEVIGARTCLGFDVCITRSVVAYVNHWIRSSLLDDGRTGAYPRRCDWPVSSFCGWILFVEPPNQ